MEGTVIDERERQRDRAKASLALGRHALHTRLINEGSVGLIPTLMDHESTLKGLGEKYGHERHLEKSLLDAIAAN